MAAIVLLVLLCALLSGCGGGADPVPRSRAGERPTVTVWIAENQPDRMRATRANADAFTRATGHRVELVGFDDDAIDPRLAAADRAGRLPDVVQLPTAEAHRYARAGVLSGEAAQEVVERLGEETFSARALSLLTRDGRLIAVPSDGWGQLLIYRRDLFRAAGLGAPASLQDVRRAARHLHGRRVAGIALGTVPATFTAESFEHVALAAGCRLVDDAGRVRLTAPACRRAFAFYVDLARHASTGAGQDVESTRDAYFAGRAAMLLWSPFLLDAMAGLRNDAIPSCPECRKDPAFLARNSGLVGPLAAPDGSHAQFGNVSAWGITAQDDPAGAQRFVEYMMSDGYVDWLGLSPQGKYPMRLGDRAAPDRFVKAWGGLSSGLERRAPLRRFYSERSIASIGEGARSFQRWGFEQGRAALVGALSGPQPITRALVSAIRGTTSPERAVREAQAAVERLDAETR